ncbi:MAG: LrgB family protein [Phreatobacter sp.]|jgi:predicted murein hydrolase (TIGR00659 family)|uniref:LrgB family protein n=1 Tax=Phreatobacter sp. TaxID=1966341 RepID=UPI00403638A6
MSRASDLWVYLSGSPLVWLAVTLTAYCIADRAALASRRHPLVNPVVVAVALIAAVLLATGTPFETYFAGAQFVHFLLGPATVALAVPLWRMRREVRRALLPMAVALIAGSFTGIVTALGLAWLAGAPTAILASVAPKSVTAGIAMGIAEPLGGLAALTAVVVVATGVFGAIAAGPLFDAMGIRDARARGFAAGLAAHGLGTARAFQVDRTMGTFAGIALGLNGLMTAVLVPLVWRWLGP